MDLHSPDRNREAPSTRFCRAHTEELPVDTASGLVTERSRLMRQTSSVAICRLPRIDRVEAPTHRGNTVSAAPRVSSGGRNTAVASHM